jgi:hypothetical protein
VVIYSEKRARVRAPTALDEADIGAESSVAHFSQWRKLAFGFANGNWACASVICASLCKPQYADNILIKLDKRIMVGHFIRRVCQTRKSGRELLRGDPGISLINWQKPIGAPGRTRTSTMFPPPDFESDKVYRKHLLLFSF